MRGRLFILLLIILLALSWSAPVLAQDQAAEYDVSYDFGEQITFRVVFPAETAIQDVTILFGPDERFSVQGGTAQPDEAGDNAFVYQIQSPPLRAFASLPYRYRVTLLNGQTFTTEFQTFVYEDNRYSWETLDGAPFLIHWYDAGEGFDLAFAQEVLGIANNGLKRIDGILKIPDEMEPIDIYVYASGAELQSTLAQSGQSQIAGHADPDLSVVTVALPSRPDRRLLMEQRLPHEIMHIMIYRALGPGSGNLPIWFSEGLASAAELYPNPDYQVLLEKAKDRDGLLPISSLCQLFPRDATSALLAYAEAASFTRFLHSQFGSSGLERLMQNYADGVGCERGVEVALGQPLTRLERTWRQELFADNAALLVLENLLPWLVILMVALIAPVALFIGSLRRVARGGGKDVTAAG